MKNIYLQLLLFALSLMACAPGNPNNTDLYNQSASLPENNDLPSNPLDWKVMTTLINKKNKTMSTLYGNDKAFEYAHKDGDAHYPAGAQLAMVTWWQKPDIHWFGANIPGKIQKIQILNFSDNRSGGVRTEYNIYQGDPLMLHQERDTALIAENINFILGCRIATVPQ